MKKNKVQVFNGFGKILGKGKVEVAYDGGKKETIDTKNIIIATGSVVRPIKGFETDGKQVVNSDHILELENVPKSMVVIGSGAVGVEFASVYARFGCDTTVVELLDRIVPIEDEDVSKQLERSFKKQGIKCLTGVKLDTMKNLKNSVKVSGKDAKGKDVALEAEMILVAIGRMPYLENLGLENTKVVVNPRGTIKVNEYCETDEPGIFAIGDVIDTAWLAHLASKEGILVVEKLAGKKVEPINHRIVPNCTYCDPEVASVGLTEAKAKEEGYDVKVGKFPFSASGKARILGETDGFIKDRLREKIRRSSRRSHHRTARDGTLSRSLRRHVARSDRRINRQNDPRPPDRFRINDGSRRRRSRSDDSFVNSTYGFDFRSVEFLFN